MSAPAFTTPFTGSLRLRSPANISPNTPRCAMGDSVAPLISLKDTGFDQTSKLNIEWRTVPPNTSEAISVEANVALNLSLRSTTNPPRPSDSVQPCPAGTLPKDFYFPAATRNLAPVISLAYNESIAVSFETINPQVSGVSANSSDSIAFWKAPVYKYSAPDTAPQQNTQETLETEKFEAYFPTKIRNRAPIINMKAPAGDWDKSAYLVVGSDYVNLNSDLARELSVSAEEDEPSLAAAAAVSKYFAGAFMSKAPEITIDADVPMVKFGLAEVVASEADAAAVRSAAPEPPADE